MWGRTLCHEKHKGKGRQFRGADANGKSLVNDGGRKGRKLVEAMWPDPLHAAGAASLTARPPGKV